MMMVEEKTQTQTEKKEDKSSGKKYDGGKIPKVSPKKTSD